MVLDLSDAHGSACEHGREVDLASSDTAILEGSVQKHLNGPYFEGPQCHQYRGKSILMGDTTEVFTFPYEPDGVELFWSITRYSALTRNTIPGKNDLFNAYNTQPDANGNITVTFSVENPEDGTYWMPVNAGEPYYFVTRYYYLLQAKRLTDE